MIFKGMDDNYATKEDLKDLWKAIGEQKKEFKEFMLFMKEMDKKLDVHIAIAETIEKQEKENWHRSAMSTRVLIAIIGLASSAVGIAIGTLFT